MILEIPAPVLRRRLTEAGLPDRAIFLGDEIYSLLTPDDVAGKLGPVLDSVLAQLSLAHGAEFDCDDFADLASTTVRLVHRRQETAGLSRTAPAFGIVWVADLQHALNVAVHKDRIAFYEPQRTGGFSLTPRQLGAEEIASIYFCKV